MNKYDFDHVTDRRHSGSMKWNVADNELPMWVADMDFKTAPEIITCLSNISRRGIFGYQIVTEEWYEAIKNWWKHRHHFPIEKEWLIFCTGVVPAISSIIRKLTTVGENILIQTPVYNIFFHSIVNNGRHLLENPLKYDGEVYTIDFDDLEKKLSHPQTTMMILCNPHNPIGKVWSKDELAHIGELCYKHHVLVLSDEIHCDLTDPGVTYTPFASISEKCRNNSITCISPTKAFNIAGLQTSSVIVPNEWIRNKVIRALNTDEIAEPNSFAIEAAIAAFTQGEEWLDELRTYLFENKQIVKDFLKDQLPQIRLVPSQATYLLWLDCRQLLGTGTLLTDFLRKETGLYLSHGEQFGKAGEYFLRMNIACPRQTLKNGLSRFKIGIEKYEGIGRAHV